VPTLFADLLLQILHADPSLPDPHRFEALSPVEWEEFTTEAIRYRLAFQVSEYIKSQEMLRTKIPESCMERLSQTGRSTLMMNLQRQAQLRQMLTTCEAEGIPFLLMKGLWIVEQLYENLAARSSGDIDILLKPEDMPRFTRLMQRLGYELDPTISDIRDIAPGNEFPLPTLDGSNRYDVHWSMTHPGNESPIDEDKIWARSGLVTLAGKPCQSLCLEDHVLLLCFHAAIHHRFLYVGPRAMVDIAQAIKTPPRPIQWEELVTRAREMGWSRGVWLMLDLVREHLGVQPPQAILDALRPDNAEDSSIRKAALEAMFMDQAHQDVMGVEVVKLFSQAHWSDRLAHVWKRLFPAPAFIAGHFQLSIHDARLPWIYPWLYVKRWQRILRDNLPKLLRLATRDPEQCSELERSQTILRWLG
jgi:Uncharacterised nucleotidyltransferase